MRPVYKHLIWLVVVLGGFSQWWVWVEIKELMESSASERIVAATYVDDLKQARSELQQVREVEDSMQAWQLSEGQVAIWLTEVEDLARARGLGTEVLNLESQEIADGWDFVTTQVLVTGNSSSIWAWLEEMAERQSPSVVTNWSVSSGEERLGSIQFEVAVKRDNI